MVALPNLSSYEGQRICKGGWHQHEVLVNHAKAFFDGIMRARNFYRLVLDTNFPFIRLIKAIQEYLCS
jgi:hypothetical protein